MSVILLILIPIKIMLHSFFIDLNPYYNNASHFFNDFNPYYNNASHFFSIDFNPYYNNASLFFKG